MAFNLRDRLKNIQEMRENKENVKNEIPQHSNNFSIPGWVSCGYLTVKREVYVDTPLNERTSDALKIIISDLRRRKLPRPKDYLFFDLETSGLSGGAGTIAFLAAFGRLARGKLLITQYLLLDYPGENDFLDVILKEFTNAVIVTYNGKTFDSQILKSRCLMNGIRPPEYFHVDLLHPARRLWKKTLGDCSQSSIETRILGLDRSGDVPGSLAPEIWFEYLKTGVIDRLMAICDHNLADISGLASMMAAMTAIAQNPFDDTKYRFDIERLSLYWRNYIHVNLAHNSGFDRLKETGRRLLREAAGKYPYASLLYAKDCMHEGNFDVGITILRNVVSSQFSDFVKSLALRTLAIDSEHRLKDAALALRYARAGLELHLTPAYQKDFEKRILRLEKSLPP
jgi:uncharacterized protein YprB with RNaseH-like and TPR domain